NSAPASTENSHPAACSDAAVLAAAFYLGKNFRALRYRLEISNKSDFNNLLTIGNISDESFHWAAPSSGVYFFRIKTIDQDQLAGPYSEPMHFLIHHDEQPPFLVLHSPGRDMTLQSQRLEVRGEVEKNAILHINGQQIQPDETGHFSQNIALQEDEVEVKVEAIDAAGNISTIIRNLTNRGDEKLVNLDVPLSIITNTAQVPISGHLRSDACLQINKNAVNAVGKFTHILHLEEGKHVVEVEAIGSDGEKEKLYINVIVDTQPPEIKIKEISKTSVVDQVPLSGRLSEEAFVTLNGKKIQITDKIFTESLVLAEGNNEFLLVADDVAGNRSFWKTSILRDSKPPEIVSTLLSIPKTQGGEIVRILVSIHDAGVGIAQSGSFILLVKKQSFKGILKHTGKEKHNFVGNVFIPPGVSGKVQVKEIRVKDLLGNTTTE
ncbi:MAG: hypothetical protein D3923_11485, partial [Candidatus Electrothrix sp. AR3]|nr:hypothetical protein [Candidatus Electrothrix sp. AR3]